MTSRDAQLTDLVKVNMTRLMKENPELDVCVMFIDRDGLVAIGANTEVSVIVEAVNGWADRERHSRFALVNIDTGEETPFQ